ncbi:replication initiation protein [Amycolatopsis sp. NBRC 101858]|uniref:replication initiator n=1 Tax=Amycolatopsis sp. NBRC 101858 TaxID=3032200 RepID=UPI0024A51581|nr:replication initiator [Amycolatopsis sp. NBRC 101858]GLY35243.1 replication initiation protein [Amycolatopsis sp. NBRC 101858]
MLTLEDRLAARVKALDYQDWRAKVRAVNGCARPIRLSGAHQLQDATTGAVLHHHGGDIFAPCGNRRSGVCPACSDRYAADAFHLIRAGLIGGDKGIPTTVGDRPRAFVTLTAPSFGPVHTARTTRNGKRRPCGCGEYHHDDDTRTGAPLDPETYDYVGSVIWQAHAGVLWQRFTMRLRREIAKRAGLKAREFTEQARLSYGKVAEYQRRGLVHFHAVVRLDGPEGAVSPAPRWAHPDLLEDAVYAAAGAVLVPAAYPDGTELSLTWGTQVDVRRIEPAASAELEDDNGQISEARLAAYIAKYATKGTGKSEAADRPIRSQLDIDHLKVTAHHRRIIQTAWDLGDLPAFEDLKLRRWAHMLAFRGHFLTKSLAYSTTFKAIRGDRQAFRLAETLERLGLDDRADSIAVVNDWAFDGSGYRDDAERELAAGIAERIRDDRKLKYSRENDHE